MLPVPPPPCRTAFMARSPVAIIRSNIRVWGIRNSIATPSTCCRRSRRDLDDSGDSAVGVLRLLSACSPAPLEKTERFMRRFRTSIVGVGVNMDYNAVIYSGYSP